MPRWPLPAKIVTATIVAVIILAAGIGGIADQTTKVTDAGGAVSELPKEEYFLQDDSHLESLGPYNATYCRGWDWAAGQADWHTGLAYYACNNWLFTLKNGRIIDRVQTPGIDLPRAGVPNDIASHAINPTGGLRPAANEIRYLYYGDMSADLVPGRRGSLVRLVSTGVNPDWRVDTGFKPDRFQLDGCWRDPFVTMIATDGFGNIYTSQGLWSAGMSYCYANPTGAELKATLPGYAPAVVVKYSPEGRVLNIETGPTFGDWFGVNAGISTNYDGSKILVSEIPPNNRVSVFSRADETSHAYDFAGTLDSAPRSFGEEAPECSGHNVPVPYDNAIDVHGYMYVLSTACRRVQKYTPDGRFMGTFKFADGRDDLVHGMVVDWHSSITMGQYGGRFVRAWHLKNPADDLCPNLAGQQIQLQEGQAINRAGDCVPGVLPVGLFRAYSGVQSSHALDADTAEGRSRLLTLYDQAGGGYSTEGPVSGGEAAKRWVSRSPQYVFDARFPSAQFPPAQGVSPRVILKDGYVYAEPACGTNQVTRIRVSNLPDGSPGFVHTVFADEIQRVEAANAGLTSRVVIGWAFPPNAPPDSVGSYIEGVYRSSDSDRAYSSSIYSIQNHYSSGFDDVDPYDLGHDPFAQEPGSPRALWLTQPSGIAVPRKGDGCVTRITHPGRPKLDDVKLTPLTSSRVVEVELSGQDGGSPDVSVQSANTVSQWRWAVDGDVLASAWQPISEGKKELKNGFSKKIILPPDKGQHAVAVQVRNSVGIESNIVSGSVELTQPDSENPILESATLPETVVVTADELQNSNYRPKASLRINASDNWGVTQMRIAGADGIWGSWMKFSPVWDVTLDETRELPSLRRVFVQVRDAAGLESDVRSAATLVAANFVPPDQEAPEIADVSGQTQVVYTNGPMSADTPELELTVEAADNLFVSDIRIAHTDGIYKEWMPFQSKIVVKLPKVNVLPIYQLIFVQVRDLRGNVSQNYSFRYTAVSSNDNAVTDGQLGGGPSGGNQQQDGPGGIIPVGSIESVEPKVFVHVPIVTNKRRFEINLMGPEANKIAAIRTSSDGRAWQAWQPTSTRLWHAVSKKAASPSIQDIHLQLRSREGEATPVIRHSTVFVKQRRGSGVVVTGRYDGSTGVVLNRGVFAVKVLRPNSREAIGSIKKIIGVSPAIVKARQFRAIPKVGWVQVRKGEFRVRLKPGQRKINLQLKDIEGNTSFVSSIIL